jgi:hypothetical protein
MMVRREMRLAWRMKRSLGVEMRGEAVEGSEVVRVGLGMIASVRKMRGL